MSTNLHYSTSSSSDSSDSSAEMAHIRRLQNTARFRGSPSSPSSENSEESETINSQLSYNSDDMNQTDSFNTAPSSSDTEDYDVEAELQNTNEGVIEINDTQMPIAENNDGNNHVDEEDDDDVVLIPQNIETIDLCTQAAPVPFRLRNEIIDITDSPGTEDSYAGPIRRHRNRRFSPEVVPIRLETHSDNRQNTNLEVVHVPITNSHVNQPPQSSTPCRNRLNFDDSLDCSQPRFALSCPICLDTLVNRQPVSTICGHLFCKNCITQALVNAKKCPMCKKALSAKKSYFDIFLPC